MNDQSNFVQKFTDILCQLKLLDRQDADALVHDFAQSSKENFVDFLREEGLVPEDDLLQALSEYYQVPAFDVVGYLFDHDLVTQFPKGVMLRHAFIPMMRDQNMLVVVASHPDDENLPMIIGDYVSWDVRFNVGIHQDILDAIKEFYDPSDTEIDPLDEEEHAKKLREQEDIEDALD